MKTLLITVFIFLSQSTCAQSENIDSLINCIDNKQVIDDGDYLSAIITLNGECVTRLLAIGKPATGKLIAVLDDSTKGVIAHCILSFILTNSGRPKVYNSRQKDVLIYLFNNFRFFRKGDLVYANKAELVKNKRRWEAF